MVTKLKMPIVIIRCLLSLAPFCKYYKSTSGFSV